jgi:hypothetical protein
MITIVDNCGDDTPHMVDCTVDEYVVFWARHNGYPYKMEDTSLEALHALASDEGLSIYDCEVEHKTISESLGVHPDLDYLEMYK